MTIEQRVAFLERRCRHLTGLLIAAMAVTMVMFFGGAAPNVEPANLQVRKLEVMDESGNVRIRLGKADEGYGVVVYDASGRHRATLTDAPRGAVMSVSKNGGDIRLMAMEDSSGLSFRDTNGKPSAVVFVTEDQSQIMLKDSGNQTVFSAPKSE